MSVTLFPISFPNRRSVLCSIRSPGAIISQAPFPIRARAPEHVLVGPVSNADREEPRAEGMVPDQAHHPSFVAYLPIGQKQDRAAGFVLLVDLR
jgi:hypothetical protein